MSEPEIRVLLAAATLPATEPEIAGLAARYSWQRAAIDALYDLPAARHALPVLGFRTGDEAAAGTGKVS
ncbi:hypothetical protein NQK81_41855 [Amycolatopsis roodepoortensis]|uniref:hypothetical protein n=1 Tax=Amycolatopsis roodepoortensis TaxID=700274 RepID=UPI00214D0AE5|nr:hypothetical protein [Amycolatopsis roodepoortensis]UUV31224.1 hypothetical protein NQK81_41855 [Amycolatopsis roodepoortensis]